MREDQAVLQKRPEEDQTNPGPQLGLEDEQLDWVLGTQNLAKRDRVSRRRRGKTQGRNELVVCIPGVAAGGARLARGRGRRVRTTEGNAERERSELPETLLRRARAEVGDTEM